MVKKIFRSNILTAMIVLLTCLIIILGILQEVFTAQLEKQLKMEASFVAAAVEKEGIGYFEKLTKDSDRVSLISADGTVLADTQADTNELENHADREEIKEAAASGTGHSVRYSATMTEKTVYYAQKLENGDIIRVSTEQYTLLAILLLMSHPIAILIIVTVVLSLVLALRVSKSVMSTQQFLLFLNS